MVVEEEEKEELVVARHFAHLTESKAEWTTYGRPTVTTNLVDVTTPTVEVRGSQRPQGQRLNNPETCRVPPLPPVGMVAVIADGPDSGKRVDGIRVTLTAFGYSVVTYLDDQAGSFRDSVRLALTSSHITHVNAPVSDFSFDAVALVTREVAVAPSMGGAGDSRTPDKSCESYSDSTIDALDVKCVSLPSWMQNAVSHAVKSELQRISNPHGG